MMTAKLRGPCCEYTLGATLGVGEYGKAIQCTKDSDGSQVVVKQVHISSLSPEEQAEAINEVRIMQELDHLNVVKYIECIKQHGCLYIVMEHCCYGELSGLIARRAKAQKPFTEQEIMFWFVQVALGLWHVHSRNILHRDLKTQNIFITKGGLLKLGDFGISRVLNSDTELAKTAIGTPYYLSPEICQDLPYNRKSDVWALGCVLYELATLRRAFTGGSLPALVVKILKGQYPPLPARYSSNLRALVDSLLQQDPKMRPSIDAVLRLDYVKHHLARYAQHVVRITTQQPAPDPASSTLSAELCSKPTAAYVQPSMAVADDGSEQQKTDLQAVMNTRCEAEAAAVAATNKAASGALRVPLPRFLRKKTSEKQQQQQQQQQAASAKGTAALGSEEAKEDKQQSRSLRDRIVRRLSSSGGSSNSDSGGILGLLQRRTHSRSDMQENSHVVQDTAHNASVNNSSKETPAEWGGPILTSNNSNGSSNYKYMGQGTCQTMQAAISCDLSAGCRRNQQPTVAQISHPSQEVTEREGEEYNCSSSSSGSSSPGSDRDSSGQRRPRQRKKLIGTCWIEQQQLALARLQADLDASPLVRGRNSTQQQQQQQQECAAPEMSIPGQHTPGAVAGIIQSQTPTDQEQLRRAGAVDANRSPAHKACSSKQTASAQKPKRHVGARSSSKGGAAVSPADVVAAARAARLAERASWQQQQAKAAENESARRAARAVQLAAALQDRAAAAHKAELEGAAAMSAHRQHMKAVQPRVQKSQLAELGAAFRQRIEQQVQAAEAAAAAVDAGTGQQAVAGPWQQPYAAAAVPSGVRILQQSSGGQAMLLDLSEGDSNAANPSTQTRALNIKSGKCSVSDRRASHRSSDKLHAGGVCSGGSSVSTSRRTSCSSSRVSSAASSKQSSQRTTPERERRQQMTRVKSAGRAQPHQPAARRPAAAAAAEKPWKVSKSTEVRRSLEPAVEIYAPFGSDMPLEGEQQNPESLQELTFGTHLENPVAAHAVVPGQQNDRSLGTATDDHYTESGRSSSPQVAEVLQQIQAAFTIRDQQYGAVNSAAVSSSNPTGVASVMTYRGRAPAAYALDLPPEAPANGCQLPATSLRGGVQGGCLHGTAAVPIAERIDALRSFIEESLGEDAFMLAYRYMVAMHNPSTDSDDESEAPYEVLLFELLGPEKVHLVHQIHKLLMLENQACGSRV